MKLDLDLFRRLCETPGVPGREERVRALIEKTVLGKAGGGMFDSSHVDNMGSLICTRKATKSARAKVVGEVVAERAKAAGITAVVFDRGGFIYHGRVKAVADGAREGGLLF